MLTPAPRTIYLKDYTPPAFLISDVALDVHLEDEQARVEARLPVHRNPKFPDREAPLVLDGEELELEWLRVEGTRLGEGQYRLATEHLTMPNVPRASRRETKVRTRPRAKTRRRGLKTSKD